MLPDVLLTKMEEKNTTNISIYESVILITMTVMGIMERLKTQ